MIEEFYGFGYKNYPETFYKNHKDSKAGDALSERTRCYTTVAFYSNLYIPEVIPSSINLPYYTSVYPKHKCKIQPEHRQAIECKCGDSIHIYRHIPQVNNLKLSDRYSTYHPQGLSKCACGLLGVIVDHKGIPRIYSDTEDFKFINYFQNHIVKTTDFTQDSISNNLLNFRYTIPTEYVARAELKYAVVNNIQLMNTEKLLDYNIICPAAPIPYLTKNTKLMSEHLRRYAFTYKLIILGKELIYLPNGVVLNTNLSFIKGLLDEPYDGIMPKYTKKKNFRSLMAFPNTFTIDAINFHSARICKAIIEHYKLPEAELKSYPSQTIGYLHLLRSDPNDWPLYKHRHYYTTKSANTQLRQLKRSIAKLVRMNLLTDVLSSARFLRDHIHYRPLKIPPIDAYLSTRYLNPWFSDVD